MTKNKVDGMKERIQMTTDDGTPCIDLTRVPVDPHKLAQVLVEMEERIEKAPIEHCGVEGCPECNKEAYKSGFLAALEEVRKTLPDELPRGAMIGYDRLVEVLDELKKNYE